MFAAIVTGDFFVKKEGFIVKPNIAIDDDNFIMQYFFGKIQ